MSHKMRMLLCLAVVLCTLAAPGCAPKITTDHPALVTFQFENNGDNVLTFWRRLDNGEKSSAFPVQVGKFALMGNSSFGKFKPHRLKLEPGLYYLDSFQVNMGSRFYVSEAGHFTARNGWDDAAGAPLFLSFTAVEGQELILPKVAIIVEGTQNEPSTRFIFEDPAGVFTVGKRVNR